MLQMSELVRVTRERGEFPPRREEQIEDTRCGRAIQRRAYTPYVRGRFAPVIVSPHSAQFSDLTCNFATPSGKEFCTAL